MAISDNEVKGLKKNNKQVPIGDGDPIAGEHPVSVLTTQLGYEELIKFFGFVL